MPENHLSYTLKMKSNTNFVSSPEAVNDSFEDLLYTLKMIFHTHNKSEENMIFYTHNKSPTLKISLFFLFQNLLCVCTTHKLIHNKRGKEKREFQWNPTLKFLSLLANGFKQTVVVNAR